MRWYVEHGQKKSNRKNAAQEHKTSMTIRQMETRKENRKTYDFECSSLKKHITLLHFFYLFLAFSWGQKPS